MNKKGVSLAELLAVVVVMGIIAAISIPLVGNVIEKTKLKSVYGDAVAIRDASRLYCTDKDWRGDFCTGKSDILPPDLNSYISNTKYQAKTLVSTFDMNNIDQANDTDPYQYFVKSNGTGNFYVEAQNDKYTYKGDPSIHKPDNGCYVGKTSDSYHINVVPGATYEDYTGFPKGYCNPVPFDIVHNIKTVTTNGKVDNVKSTNVSNNLKENPLDFSKIIVPDKSNLGENDKPNVLPNDLEDKTDITYIDANYKPLFAELVNNITKNRSVIRHQVSGEIGYSHPDGLEIKDEMIAITNPYETIAIPYSYLDVSGYNAVDAVNSKISLHSTATVEEKDDMNVVHDIFTFQLDNYPNSPNEAMPEDEVGLYGFTVRLDVTYTYNALYNNLEWTGEFVPYVNNVDEALNVQFETKKAQDEVVDKVAQTYLYCVFGPQIGK